MRVGIYNRWLSTLGGGEKHSLAVAEYLSRDHTVEILSHKEVSRDKAAERLALDLSRVQFNTVPDQKAGGLSILSRSYDFFLNASYMDFFPSLAPRSAALIFFPAKLNRQIAFKRRIKSWIRSALQMPDMGVGVQNFEMLPDGLRWHLDTVTRLRLPAGSFRLRFNLQSVDPRVTHARISLNEAPYESIRLEPGGTAHAIQLQVSEMSGGQVQVVIETTDPIQPDGAPKLFLSDFDIDLPGYRLYRSLLEHRYKGWALMMQYNPPAYAILDYMRSYNQIWANSDFTRRWIRRYWNLESEILYPMVDVDQFAPREKGPQILNVGRFFSGNHNKKHLEMVNAFRQMVDSGLNGWSLHLAGVVAPEPIHREYFEEVRRQAEGYPIVLHPDIPYAQLKDLYEHSSLYWHASGYGEDENKDPDRFEHFGITTVEAMASGCCPVVIAKGGQPEIVEHGKSGFLWRTPEELRSFSSRLIQNADMRQVIAAAAVARSQQFGRKHFTNRLDRLLAALPE